MAKQDGLLEVNLYQIMCPDVTTEKALPLLKRREPYFVLCICVIMGILCLPKI